MRYLEFIVSTFLGRIVLLAMFVGSLWAYKFWLTLG